MTYIGEVSFDFRTLEERFLTSQNAKSPSASVGAKAVGWTGGGLYGRPWGSGAGPRLLDAQDEKDLPASLTCHPEYTLVILSDAKDLSQWGSRSFVSLRMTKLSLAFSLEMGGLPRISATNTSQTTP